MSANNLNRILIVLAFILFFVSAIHSAVFETELNKFTTVKTDQGKNAGFLLRVDLPNDLAGSSIDQAEISFLFKGDSCRSDYLTIDVHPLTIPLLNGIDFVKPESISFDESYLGFRSLRLNEYEWTDIRIDEIISFWNSNSLSNLGLVVTITDTECGNVYLRTVDGSLTGVIAKVKILYTKQEVKK